MSSGGTRRHFLAGAGEPSAPPRCGRPAPRPPHPPATRPRLGCPETRRSPRRRRLRAQLGHDGDGDIDRVLNGPTNEAWLDPWVDRLCSLGVEFVLSTQVREVLYGSGRITGVRVGAPDGAAAGSFPRTTTSPRAAGRARKTGLGARATGGRSAAGAVRRPAHGLDGGGAVLSVNSHPPWCTGTSTVWTRHGRSRRSGRRSSGTGTTSRGVRRRPSRGLRLGNRLGMGRARHSVWEDSEAVHA
jgi:hypothetical protein